MARRACLVVALACLAACNPDTVVHKVGWFATMRHQRNIKPYARPIPAVPGTVPVSGAELPVTRETADRLVNPRTRTAESLNRGQWVYQTYCLVCHGEHGLGNGPVSLAGGGPFPGIPSLVDPSRPKMTDGAIYGMIVEAQRMGRGLMPRYGDKIHGNDRWDLVNYVRSLQLSARGNQ
ncbi:MAG TPA: cytochrome c [Gemmatimonadales bacterium]|nr:cytochrome c [Gemmatimonadales bacterium]